MKASAGTYESSDCIITVSHSEETIIEIDSIVFDQFGDQIQAVLSDTLKENNITKVKVVCFDKGALDYTIKARLETALRRGGYLE
jgi:citrate lyase subunit gamma (acyl carrier protein)